MVDTNADARLQAYAAQLALAQGRPVPRRSLHRVPTNGAAMFHSDIPDTMRGWQLTGHGGFKALAWRRDIPVPRPGPGEVPIRVAVAAINNTDVNTRTAWYSKSVRGATEESGVSNCSDANHADSAWDGGGIVFPHIHGADSCDHVAAVGEGVDATRIGERVMPPTGPCRASHPDACAFRPPARMSTAVSPSTP